MSRDILDLIDNAIAGATSEDAMRWTPDAERVTEPPLTFGDLMREYENALDARVLGPQVGPALTGLVPISVDPIQRFRPIFPGLAPSVARSPIPITGGWTQIEVHFARGGDIPATTANVSLAESLSSFLRHAGATIAPAVETMRRAGMIPEQPPVDPMARALWLRQHRNTGPAARARAPRRIDARRTR